MVVVLAVGTSSFNIDVPVGRLVQAVLSAVLLALVFGSLALAVGASSGKSPVAGAMAAVLAVNSYLINAFTPLSDAVDAFKARPVLPLQRRRPGPERGADPLHLLFLAFLTFVFLSVAQITFDRRDVGTA